MNTHASKQGLSDSWQTTVYMISLVHKWHVCQLLCLKMLAHLVQNFLRVGGLVAGRVRVWYMHHEVCASVIAYPIKYINIFFGESIKYINWFMLSPIRESLSRGPYVLYTKSCHTLSWIDAWWSTDSTNLLLNKLSEISKPFSSG
jgi:uncharacterized membrane protein